MNKREKELYGKKQWKHTNPIETLNKALKDINFSKNGVMQVLVLMIMKLRRKMYQIALQIMNL